jgi:hypothetical protein
MRCAKRRKEKEHLGSFIVFGDERTSGSRQEIEECFFLMSLFLGVQC